MTFTQGAPAINCWKTLCKSWLVGAAVLLLASCRATPPTEPPAGAAVPVAPAANAPDSNSAAAAPDNAPPPPPPNSYLAQLPPETTNQLIALNINIAIPTYLPQAMSLANYGAGETPEGVGGGPYYWLVYRDDQNRCFAIEYASGGIGGISLENQEPLDSALFGDGYSLYHGKFPNGGDGELPESDLFTDWLEGDDGFYRLVGSGLVNAQDYGQGDCSNITVKEAIAVVESLSYLPTDIKTLDVAPPAREAPTPEDTD